MKNYLTLDNMGGSGGLCTQLQIYASLLAVAEHNNMDVVFSKKNSPLQLKDSIFIVIMSKII